MSINTRIIEAAKTKLTAHKVFKELEVKSGISANSWRKVAEEKQRATSEMIEFVCRKWPEYAFWICTGFLADGSIKHTNPIKEKVLNLDLNLNELLKKEPVDWTLDEFRYIHIKAQEEKNQVISKNPEFQTIVININKSAYQTTDLSNKRGYQFFCSPLQIAYETRLQEISIAQYIKNKNEEFEEEIEREKNPSVKGLENHLEDWVKCKENFSQACNDLMKIRGR